MFHENKQEDMTETSSLEKIIKLSESITSLCKHVMIGGFSADEYKTLHHSSIMLLSEVVNLKDFSAPPSMNAVKHHSYPIQHSNPSFNLDTPDYNDFSFKPEANNAFYFEPFPSNEPLPLIHKANTSISTTLSDVYSVLPEVYSSTPLAIQKAALTLENEFPPPQRFNYKPLDTPNVINLNNNNLNNLTLINNLEANNNNTLATNVFNNNNNDTLGSPVVSTSSSPLPTEFIINNPCEVGNKRKRKMMNKTPNLSCLICHETVTPEWRKGPDGNHTLCNACGLNYAKKIKYERQNLERQGHRKQSIDVILNYKKHNFSKQIEEERAKKYEKKKVGSPPPNALNSSVGYVGGEEERFNSNLSSVLKGKSFANNSSLTEALQNILSNANPSPSLNLSSGGLMSAPLNSAPVASNSFPLNAPKPVQPNAFQNMMNSFNVQNQSSQWNSNTILLDNQYFKKDQGYKTESSFYL